MKCILSILMALLVFAQLSAEEPANQAEAVEAEQQYLARWALGNGFIANVPSSAVQMIGPADVVIADPDIPGRIELLEPAQASITLAPGSRLRLTEEHNEQGESLLICWLDEGMVQIDLRDRAAYSAVLLRGASTETEILGTLLTGERMSRKRDFIALIRGSIKVRLRREVALALQLNPNDEVELGPRQGISADSSSGLGAVTALSARPQLDKSASSRSASQDEDNQQDEEGEADSQETDPADMSEGDLGEEQWSVDLAEESMAEWEQAVADSRPSQDAENEVNNVAEAGPQENDVITEETAGTKIVVDEIEDEVENDEVPEPSSDEPEVVVDETDIVNESIAEDAEPAVVVETDLEDDLGFSPSSDISLGDELAEEVAEDIVDDLVEQEILDDEVIETITEVELGDFPGPPN